MAKLNMAEEYKVLPILAPADIVATATATQYVRTKDIAGQLEIAVQFGAIASTDSTGEAVVTIVGNDVSDTSTSDNNEVAIAFKYRLSAAVGTDSMGTLSDATSAGAAVNNATDNVTMLCYVDPSVLGQKFVRAVITPTSEVTSTIVAATARFIPRYAQASTISST